MAEMTEEQRLAAQIRGKNILVNAAAGSGKTKVLTERIIGIVSDRENPVDIDSLLIVTFTKAAAREMRERISGALTKKAIDNPDDKHLRKQLILLNNADITTIDAFCLDVVKSNFHRLDLDPSFSIISGTEAEIIRDEIMDEVFEDKYAGEDEAFFEIAQRYSDNNKDDKIREITAMIYKYLSSVRNIDEEIERMKRLYSEPFETGEYMRAICRAVSDIIGDIAEKYDSAVNTLSKYPDDVGSAQKMTDIIQYELNQCICIKNLLDDYEWDRAAVLYNDIKFKKASWSGIDELHKKQINNCRDRLKKIPGEYFVYESKAVLNEKISGSYRTAAEVFLKLAKEFSDKYMQKKRSINKFEFSDIERMCLELLYDNDGGRSELCLELEEKYYEIMIDEYQDSNQLQEDIFSAISNGKNMFMVGDMKQSIYAFRNSDPTLFKSKCSFPSDPCADSDNVKVVLSKNFRSNAGCINAVNEIFSDIMSEKCGGIDYDDEQKLHLGNMNYDESKNPENFLCAELDIINTALDKESDKENAEESGTEKDDEAEESAEELDKIRLEARYAAKRICELKRGGYMTLDKNTNTYRPLENRDIAVLLRSGVYASVYADELNNCGVSAYAQGGGYFGKPEVRIMLAFLRVINNPLCDIPFIAVMCSVIYGISEERLAEVHMFNRKNHIYENITDMLKEGAGDKNLKRFAEDIERFRDYAKYMPCDKLIWTIYEQTGFYDMCAAMTGGEEKCANLVLLFERARTFEDSGFKGLFNFIKLIERLMKKTNDMSEASLINETHNVVNIMTIHKSKGLEFPVVILSQASKLFNKSDLSKTIITDKDLGLGIDYYEPEKYYFYPTIIKNIIKEKKRISLMSEEMRVLYVALTRAREKIIVTSVINESQEKIENYRYMKPQEAKSYNDWILQSRMRSGQYWELNQISKAEAADFVWEEEDIEESRTEPIDTANIFSFDYKYKKLTGVEAKISVTELKRRAAEEDDEVGNIFGNDIIVKKPEFLRDDKITNAQRGTLMHSVMQNIMLRRDIDEEYLDKEIARLAECGVFTEKETEYIDKSRIIAFFNSDIGKRMTNADKVYREMRFEIPISAAYIIKDNDENIQNEHILLQGIIDCYFEEDGEIVLIDYKTDYYTDKNEIRKKYELQLDCYKKAVEILTKKTVKNSYLYLFFNNDVV